MRLPPSLECSNGRRLSPVQAGRVKAVDALHPGWLARSGWLYSRVRTTGQDATITPTIAAVPRSAAWLHLQLEFGCGAGDLLVPHLSGRRKQTTSAPDQARSTPASPHRS